MISCIYSYWRKEMEQRFETREERERYQKEHPFDIAGEGLNETEKEEQKVCLLSKKNHVGPEGSPTW